MDKLLIAERNAPLRDGLVQLLRRQFDITTCTDGRTALELLDTRQFQVVILDLELTELEGIYVLEQAADHLPPITLIITDFCNDYVVQTLQDLAVGYIFRKPCQPRVIASRVEHLRSHVPASGHPDLQSRAAHMLLSLHFAAKKDGFLYLKFAIPLLYQDPSQLICKDIYGAITQIWGLGSWKVAERSIRSAIQDAYAVDPEGWSAYFPGANGPPTNKAFICRMVQILDESES